MRRAVWLIALATIGWVPRLPAAPCAPGTICAEYDAAAMVFLARVAQVVPENADFPLGPLRPQTVTFDVIEDFKGTAGSGTTLAFDPGAAGARPFSNREGVLVFARR